MFLPFKRNRVPVAFRNLHADRIRFAINVAGVAFAVLLICFQLSILKGTRGQITTYIDNTGADIWAMQKGVDDFVATSAVPRKSVEVLKNIGLGHRIHHLPADLSAGEKQRVAFARALVNNPRIIPADEPTANLDAENRDTVVGLLRRAIEEQNVGVIIATHDERIQEVADRIVRIEDGQPTDDRRNRPQRSAPLIP